MPSGNERQRRKPREGESSLGVFLREFGPRRATNGTYHKMSFKHLKRYVAEFAARHNVRDLDSIDQMAALVKGMEDNG